MMTGPSKKGVTHYIDYLQSERIYHVTRKTLLSSAGVSETAVVSSVERLKKKHRLVEPRRGFLVIVPLEYLSAGSPPVDWWLDHLMRYLNQRYHVGLLSAAAHHGAVSEHPDAIQVLTNKSTALTASGRARIEFHVKSLIDGAKTETAATPPGGMIISTAEETAFDLVRYPRAAGGLDEVARVLDRLAPKLKPQKLLDRARRSKVATAQKLGYLLDGLGHGALTGPMHSCVMANDPVRTPLCTSERPFAGRRDSRWQVVVNCAVNFDR
jgi:predicted transcriptional regulator of viral defense system